MAIVKNFVFTSLTAILAIYALRRYPPRFQIPEHLLGHKAVVIPNLISQEDGEDLINLMKSLKTLGSLVNDERWYETKHEHIGEGRPLERNGICDHPYLVPNTARNLCIIPQRFDIARHFMTYGGFDGLKEPFDQAVSRLQSFGHYVFDLEKYPQLKKLFDRPKFKEATTVICPDDKKYLDRAQFNFIVQIPGQTVALHLDAVYFWGADRFLVPQWLLAAMKFSGLYEKEFINQVQVVGYLHKWSDDRAGHFVYWENETAIFVPPTSMTGTVTDGSKVVHAGLLYKPSEKPPIMSPSAKSELVYQGDDVWHLTSNGVHLKNYTTDDLRITIVYRGKCFKDAEEAERWRNFPADERMTLDGILDTLSKDMIKRGTTTKEALAGMNRLDLAFLIMDTYIRYPLPRDTVLIPFNYCAAGKHFPALKPFLGLIC